MHLKVADLERAVSFYRDALGFEEQGRIGARAAFLSSGPRHHLLALNTWQSAGGPRPDRCATGLYSFGVRYPTRAALARAVQRLIACGVELLNASDHGICESVYFEDPDGNRVEVYWDRPAESWPQTTDGRLAVIDMPLDLASLLTEIGRGTRMTRTPA